MFIPKIIRYLIALIFLINACNTQRSDFSSNEKHISGKKLEIGCLIGGSPVEIVCIDNLLLYYDKYENQTVTVFNTQNEQFVRRFLTIGKGPGEVIAPVKLFVSPIDKKICVFQMQTGHVNVYEPNEIITQNQITTPHQIFLGDRPANIKKIKDGYIGIGMFDGGRYRLYDSIGNMVSECGQYPFRGEEMDQMGRFFLYQGVLSTSADGSCFAMGTSYCDNLEFYRIENGTAILTKRYENYDVKAQFSNVIRMDDDCVMNYKAAYGGKYCYMLYSGKTYLEQGRFRSAGGRKIIVFDWNGNYIKSFIADVDIYSFCVDEENNIIYAIAYDKEDEGGFIIKKIEI